MAGGFLLRGWPADVGFFHQEVQGVAAEDTEGRFHLLPTFFGKASNPAVVGLGVGWCGDCETLVVGGGEGNSSPVAETLELSLVFGPGLSDRTEDGQLFPGCVGFPGVPESGVEG